MSENEDTSPLKIELTKGTKINGFMAGPDDLLLGLEIVPEDGPKVVLIFCAPGPITELFDALGNAQNMTLIRNMKVLNILHEEVGCPQAHEIMARSLEDLIETPTSEADGKKPPELYIVKH